METENNKVLNTFFTKNQSTHFPIYSLPDSCLEPSEQKKQPPPQSNRKILSSEIPLQNSQPHHQLYHSIRKQSAKIPLKHHPPFPLTKKSNRTPHLFITDRLHFLINKPTESPPPLSHKPSYQTFLTSTNQSGNSHTTSCSHTFCTREYRFHPYFTKKHGNAIARSVSLRNIQSTIKQQIVHIK